MSANEASIRRLQTTFGGNLERDVLEAVLALHGGDVQQTINFLQAGQNDYIDPGPAATTSLPSDYMTKPRGYSLAQIQKHTAVVDEAHRFKSFFLAENVPFGEHLKEQCRDYSNYTAVLLLLLHNGVNLSTNCKARALASAWARSDSALFDYLLAQEEKFGFVEVLKAIKMLDAPRKARAMEKKIHRMQKQGKIKPRTLARVRALLSEYKQDALIDLSGITGAGSSSDTNTVTVKVSVSGALCKRIRKWISRIPVEKLSFFALQMPKEPWKELADVTHCAPRDFQINWFLSYCFGTAAPADSIVAECSGLDESNMNELITKHDIPYSFVRTRVAGSLPNDLKARIAEYETIDVVLWFYGELQCAQVDAVICKRLEAGDIPKFAYGKFMERLLYARVNHAPFYHLLLPVAEQRLSEIELPLEPPVAVLGDASFSMDVAIRVSTIIASLLASLSTAELRFFNNTSFAPDTLPRSADGVLSVAVDTKADGLTAPAVGLWEFYQQKKVVKSFVVVTDEIENEAYRGFYFAQLFYKYYTEVYPAKLVFVSFLDDPKQKGRMVKALESFGIVPLQFRLDSRLPDLTKVDTLLGLLSAESSHFVKRTKDIAELLRNKTIPFTDVVAEVERKTFPRSDPSASTDSSTSGKTEEEDATAPTTQQRDPDEGNCVICMDQRADMALVECGHLVCADCSTNLKTCPFCRAPVVRTLKIFTP